MGHFKRDTTPAASCDALLVKATRIYLGIETLYQSMQTDLSATSVLQVMRTVGILNALLQDAQTVDNLIATTLKTESILTEATQTLLNKREDILKRLYQDNQQITNRAESVKSLLRHEISSLSTNRHALQGYKPAGTERKHIIRDSY